MICPFFFLNWHGTRVVYFFPALVIGATMTVRICRFINGLKSQIPEKNLVKGTIRSSQELDSTHLEPFNKKSYSVQVGAFISRQYARERVTLLNKMGYSPYLITESDSQKRVWHTVHIGKYATRHDAQISASAVTAKTKYDAVVRLFDGS